MRFWVDIANSPHAPLFAPVVDELRDRGHDVVMTAWDRAQTEQLARSFWPDVVVVGAGSERGLLAKALRIRRRARALAEAVRARAPDVALGHNSYAQLLAARSLGIPSVTMMDYEHQPANHLAFRLAARVVVPEEFPDAALRRLGAARKTVRYVGLKEEVALAGFRPDPAFRSTLGVADADVLVTCRPPPEGALYHRKGNALFDRAVERAVALGGTVVLSPRDADQAERYRRVRGVRVLDRAIHGANLLFHSDLVIGAGGTMTREASVLGTPSYSLFAGRLASVDRSLVRRGLLTLVTAPADLDRIRIEKKGHGGRAPGRERLEQVVSLIEGVAAELPR